MGEIGFYFVEKPKLGIKMPKMGIKKIPAVSAPSASLVSALFSGTQQRVLGLLFGQPDRSFYATELINLAGVGSGAVQRELARLAQSGLVTLRPVGNQKHYQANPESPIYAELCGMVRKTVGLAEPLRAALAPLTKQITAAFVYGSIAKQQDTAGSDIDLMLLSEKLSYSDLYLALENVSAQLGRTVNPTLLTEKDLSKRIKTGEAFITRVLAQPKIWVMGGENDFRV